MALCLGGIDRIRLPEGTFLLTTGAAVVGWTTGIFVLAGIFGEALVTWLQRFSHATVLLMIAVLMIVLLLRTGFPNRAVMNDLVTRRQTPAPP